MREWYGKYERPISSLSLLGGFAFNVFALTRVDLFWDNFWIVAHLFIVAGCILLLNRQENEGDVLILSKDPERLHFWLVNILQFFFGGLLSTFLVFYFRSAVLSVAWPFLLILVIAFIANESLKRQYARLGFQVGFLYLCVFLFASYIVPVIVHQIGSIVFILSGATSLLIIGFFVLVIARFTHENFRKSRVWIFGAVGGVFVIMNVLYFYNLIPPLPLSLQDAGIYHSVVRTADGNYTVTYEDGGLLSRILPYVNVYPTYHVQPGKAAYAYTAVFSPTELNTTITHEWQKYDDVTKKWVTYSKVTLPLLGGRDGGYRTYSIKAGLSAGKWRVNVMIPTGALVGRLSFLVAVDAVAPTTQTEIKY
jgi:hypothetical protein